ncbi:putative phosphoribosyl 1,2-cyclic phosphate 1,2-diphosphodiesterase [Dioscorea sansibarensis]
MISSPQRSTGSSPETLGDVHCNGKKTNKKKRLRKRKRNKKKVTPELILASNYVHRWAFGCLADDPDKVADRVLFELHCHSSCSDGFLPPSAVVERAHVNGVKVLALTDHDTMAGVSEAMEAARKFNIKVIPGVEISTVYSPREESEIEEPVHILAYYGSCGPARYEELERVLVAIREGRYLRARDMLIKLGELKMPLEWEHVVKIAGNGVAPGRLHVAQALVEAGYVENLKQAFSRYLYDGGPAYAKGNEPFAEAVVQLICRTGGVAALAHPWALKNPLAIIKSLKAAGLHAIEVYRSDGKLAGFSDLADTNGLVKLGGSDYHGRRGDDEPDLGCVDLPVFDVYEFLKLARSIWYDAMKDMLLNFAEKPMHVNIDKLLRFRELNDDTISQCLSSWLDNEENAAAEFEAIRLKISHIMLNTSGLQMPVMSG